MLNAELSPEEENARRDFIEQLRRYPNPNDRCLTVQGESHTYAEVLKAVTKMTLFGREIVRCLPRTLEKAG